MQTVLLMGLAMVFVAMILGFGLSVLCVIALSADAWKRLTGKW